MPDPQRDPPPHVTSYSFEIVPQPTVPTGAYITEEADSDTGSDDNVYTMELYDTVCMRSLQQRKRTQHP